LAVLLLVGSLPEVIRYLLLKDFLPVVHLHLHLGGRRRTGSCCSKEVHLGVHPAKLHLSLVRDCVAGSSPVGVGILVTGT